jgi:hypothetical protein
MNGMRIVIQDRATKLFYTKERQWVQRADDASEFPTPLTAMRVSARERLGDTEVVFIPLHALKIPPDTSPRGVRVTNR